jgi:hypothetical protein
MKKVVAIIVTALFYTNAVRAQLIDTVFYFTGKGVRVKTSAFATYYRIIKPPAAGEKLYDVKEYYIDGKLKRAGKSNPEKGILKEGKVSWQGAYRTYYPNGAKEWIANFDHDAAFGQVEQYYPNGKIYSVTGYPNGKLTQLITCYDTLGTMTAQNGKGRWLFYYDGLKKLKLEGNVENGTEEGLWIGHIIDSVHITSVTRFEYVFDKGKVQSSQSYDSAGKPKSFVKEMLLARYTGKLYSLISKINRILRLTSPIITMNLWLCSWLKKTGL